MFSKELDTLRRNKNAQRILELVVNSVFILILLAAVGFPLFQNIRTLRANNQQVQTLRVRLEEKRENITQAEQQVQALGDTKILLEEAIPLVPKQFDLLNQVKTVAEARQVAVDQMQHKASDTNEVEFTLMGSGTYRQSVDFLRALEVLPRLIQITNIQMSVDAADESGDPELTISITGEGYYYPEPVSIIRPTEVDE